MQGWPGDSICLRCAVEEVSEQGKSQGGQMCADLVRAACLRARF